MFPGKLFADVGGGFYCHSRHIHHMSNGIPFQRGILLDSKPPIHRNSQVSKIPTNRPLYISPNNLAM